MFDPEKPDLDISIPVGAGRETGVVCVLGMHRSGTSLLTNMLRKCGLELGPSRDIMEPSQSDNPDGYWENIHFVEVNDRILEELGGTWDKVPSLERGWSEALELAPLRAEAEGLAYTYARYPLWGWKDPRTMLTIEFWRNVMPNMRYILLVRNPIEVAMSLGRRRDHGVVFDEGLSLWRRYYEVALQTVQLDECLVVHYDALQAETERELNRILDHLGLRLETGQMEDALAVLNPNLHRNVFPTALMDMLPIERKTQRLYAVLCSRSGPQFKEVAAQEAPTAHEAVASASEVVKIMVKGFGDIRRQARKDAAEVRQEATKSANEVARLSKGVADFQKRIENLTSALESTRKEMDRRGDVITSIRTGLETKDEAIKSKVAQVQALEQRVAESEKVRAEQQIAIVGLQDKIGELQTKLVALESERQQLVMRSQQLSNSDKGHCAELDAAKDRIAALERQSDQLEAARSRIKELESHTRATEQQMLELHNHLVTLEGSASWKVTKPLRAVRKLFG